MSRKDDVREFLISRRANVTPEQVGLPPARAAAASRAAREAKPVISSVRASVQRVLDGMAVPAIVYNTHQDIIGSNLLGRAMFAPLFDAQRPNMTRFVFLDSQPVLLDPAGSVGFS